MKQKIVVKVHMKCEKCRTKALKTASKAYGVESVALDGDDKVVVVGDRVDSVELTKSLRKIAKFANIESVEEVKPKEEEEEEKEKEKCNDDENKSILPPMYYNYHNTYPMVHVVEQPSSCIEQPSSCSIM